MSNYLWFSLKVTKEDVDSIGTSDITNGSISSLILNSSGLRGKGIYKYNYIIIQAFAYYEKKIKLLQRFFLFIGL